MTIWTSYLGSEVRYVAVAGVRTRVVITAGSPDGRPVLALHGRGGHLESFHRNVPALARHGRVVSVDLLGHGLTAHAGTSYDLQEIAGHLRSVIEIVDDGRGFDVVAQSVGAWAAMLVALEGGPIHRLVLVEPAGLQTQADRIGDARVAKAARAGGRAFDEPTEANVRLRFAQLLHDPATCEDEMVALRHRLYSLPGAGMVHKRVRTADNEHLVLRAHRLARIDRPTLFVRGEHGHLPESLLVEVAGAMPSARVETLPRAKQWPHYEQPLQFNELVHQHLER